MNRPVPSSEKAKPQPSSDANEGLPDGGRVESYYARLPEPREESKASGTERDTLAHDADRGATPVDDHVSRNQSPVASIERHLHPQSSHEPAREDDWDRKPAAREEARRAPGTPPSGEAQHHSSNWAEDDETVLMGHSYRTLWSQDIPDFVRQHATTLTFPQKLMLMLVQVEKASAKSGRKSADMPVGWLDNGMAFVIRDQEALVKDWLPVFFKQSKFPSFTRKLYRWRFRQVFTANVGPSPEGSQIFFGHEYFQRDNKSLLSKMTSVTAEGRRRREAASLRAAASVYDLYGSASLPLPSQQQQQHSHAMCFPPTVTAPLVPTGPPLVLPAQALSLSQLLAASSGPSFATMDPTWSLQVSQILAAAGATAAAAAGSEQAPPSLGAPPTAQPAMDANLLQLLLLHANARSSMVAGAPSALGTADSAVVPSNTDVPSRAVVPSSSPVLSGPHGDELRGRSLPTSGVTSQIPAQAPSPLPPYGASDPQAASGRSLWGQVRSGGAASAAATASPSNHPRRARPPPPDPAAPSPPPSPPL